MCSIGFLFFFGELASLSPNSSTLPDAASTNFPSIKSGVYLTVTDGLTGTSSGASVLFLAIVLLKLGVVLPEGNTIQSNKVHYYKTQNQGTLEHF